MHFSTSTQSLNLLFQRLETSPSSPTCPLSAIKTWGAATCGSQQTWIAQRPLNRQFRNVVRNIDWRSCNRSIHRVCPLQSLRQARKSHVPQKVTSHVSHDVYNWVKSWAYMAFSATCRQAFFLSVLCDLKSIMWLDWSEQEYVLVKWKWYVSELFVTHSSEYDYLIQNNCPSCVDVILCPSWISNSIFNASFTWQLLNNIYTTTFVCQALHYVFSSFSNTYITSKSSSQTCAISTNISDFLSYEFRMRRSGAPSQRIPGGFSGNLPISLSPKTAPTLTSPDALSSPSASKNPRLDSDFHNSSPAPNSANYIGGNPFEVKYVGRSVQEQKHVGHFSSPWYQKAKPQSPLSHQRSPLLSLNLPPAASSQPPPTGA